MILLRRLCVPLLLLAIAATLLLSTSHRRVVAQQDSKEQKLWGIYWTVESGFTSTLEMKNNLAAAPLRVGISLYLPNGEEYVLDPVQLGPRQTSSGQGRGVPSCNATATSTHLRQVAPTIVFATALST